MYFYLRIRYFLKPRGGAACEGMRAAAGPVSPGPRRVSLHDEPATGRSGGSSPGPAVARGRFAAERKNVPQGRSKGLEDWSARSVRKIVRKSGRSAAMPSPG